MADDFESSILQPLQQGKMTLETVDRAEPQRKIIRNEDRYGCWTCRPRFLQVFNSIRWHVFWQCVFNFFEGFIVNGVINVVIPSLEKRYEMSSSRSSIIASANDFGALVVLIFISYYGGQRNKPRIMAAGVFLMSLGSLIFSLPQFVGDEYKYTVSSGTNGTQNLCMSGKGNTSSGACEDGTSNSSGYDGYYACFLIGQAFLGIGAIPMFTIALTYIDDNCKPKLTSFYIGCTFSSAAVGVAVGYIVGGQTLSYFVDADKVDISSVPLTPADPQWVGAWWIGILISFFSFLLIGFPLLGYPKELPGHDQLQKLRRSEAHNNDANEMTTRPNFGKSWRDFPKSFYLLVRFGPSTTECVQPKQRSLAIGVELLVVRLLGTTPGPILLGAIIDSACSVWQESCGKTGSCWTYRKFDLGVRLVVWFAAIKLMGAIFAMIAYKVYVPPPVDDDTVVAVPSVAANVDNSKKDESTRL
ncbi:solute carrier organic anion transporter family member 4A1-like [Ylistrum balloti]|uniref:solute carrier organic anion transporter family member 4A1-like n=1 Tax=Ylistrum balloti TaxID=509963 RepID=UPI002905BAA5|nr:solute carrier organic anion transporter family member 4A1-like [Ylistrum balloti]